MFSKIKTVSGCSFSMKTHIILETIQGFQFSHKSRFWISDAFWNLNQLLKQFIIWEYSTIQNKTYFHNLQNNLNYSELKQALKNITVLILAQSWH